MSTYTTETDRIEAAGRKAGEAIWSAIEYAYEAGLTAKRSGALLPSWKLSMRAIGLIPNPILMFPVMPS